MSKQSRKVIFGDDLKKQLISGVEKTYNVAKASYGPGAGNAIIELPYGDPLISRDGVTNVDQIFLEDPLENMAARTIVQASKKSNQKVGDGTTASVILACVLYHSVTALGKDVSSMEKARMIESAGAAALEALDSMTIDVKDDETLRDVAVISAGDEALGHMIADVINEIGLDGGVTVEDFGGAGIYNEIVDGFHFRKGYTHVNLTNDPSNLESRHENVDILISEKRLGTTSDIAPILEKIVSKCGTGKELVLVGDCSEEVLSILMLNRLKGIINVTVVDVPVFGAMRSLTLEDLALVTSAKVYLPGANAADFELSMLGGAEKVIINEYTTTILDGDGDKKMIEARVSELRKQLKEAEATSTVEALKERIARLTGKVAVIRVGGATEVEQGEVKLRVQDAVCAVQAAIRGGIVPGGGIALYNLSKYLDHKLAGVFAKPLLALADNSGYNTSEVEFKLQGTNDPWLGFNFRSGNQELVNLREDGIIDPALVIKEVVRNATSVAAKLITTEVGIVYANRDQKHD